MLLVASAVALLDNGRRVFVLDGSGNKPDLRQTAYLYIPEKGEWEDVSGPDLAPNADQKQASLRRSYRGGHRRAGSCRRRKKRSASF